MHQNVITCHSQVHSFFELSLHLKKFLVVLFICLISVTPTALSYPGSHDAFVPPPEVVKNKRALLLWNLGAKQIYSKEILFAILKVDRIRFIPASMSSLAYEDKRITRPDGVTVDKPSSIATLLQISHIKPNDEVLVLDTGSGYLSAVASQLGADVTAMPLTKSNFDILAKEVMSMGYPDLEVSQSVNWSTANEKLNLDAIVIPAKVTQLPAGLIQQLKVGGRLVCLHPEKNNVFLRIIKTSKGLNIQQLIPNDNSAKAAENSIDKSM